MNFEKINPISLIDDNIVVTNLGDISFCYKIELPETNTISIDKYNAMHQSLLQLFLLLPENTLLHRQDVFINTSFDVNDIFGTNDFFEKSLHQHFQGRSYLSQNSYLYITMLNGFGFKRGMSFNYFKKLTHSQEFEKKIKDFNTRIEKAIAILQEHLKIRKLTFDEIVSLADKHLNGYEPNKISSPVFSPKFQIGNKHFATYGLDNDLNQKDGSIDLAIVNKKISTEISTMYEGYLASLGYNLGYEHTLNSYIFYDEQLEIKRMLESEKAKLNGLRMFGSANSENAERLANFLGAVEKDNVKIVRTHFNVTIWDDDFKMFQKKDKNLQTVFGKLGIVPTEYIYNDMPYIFVSGFIGCGGYLPKDYTFVSYLNLALAYTLYEGTGLVNADKGYYYCNRSNNVPFRLDTFFAPYEDGVIDNRNYFVIAPSGGGKSFSSRGRILQQYYMGFDQVVINIGGDDKICKLINSFGKDEALYVRYEQGQTLPINPFYVEDTIDNDKIEFLVNFIWLLWDGQDDVSTKPDVNSILNKILLSYYNVDLSSGSEGKFTLRKKREEYSINTFFHFLEDNKELIESFYRGDSSIFKLNSLIINLEKFAIGSYSNLFLRTKPSLGDKKKYIEFELDNIKDHPFLFPIFSMLISDITFNTMWTTTGYKDFFIDEAWKILEKKGMSVLLKYLYKTIRKFDGAVGIAVQQITDLSMDVIIEKAILGNCAIKYILKHDTVLEQIPLLKEKLSLKDTDVAMLLSIKNSTKNTDKIKYTEQLLIMGSDFSRVVRNETSPELAVIFDSEKSRLKRFNDLYEKNNQCIEDTITEYLTKE